MFPFRTMFKLENIDIIPFYLYSIGCHIQSYQSRPEGFPSHQIFITKRGEGVFRFFELGDLVLKADQALFIAAGVPHEYYPLDDKPWELGYFGFLGCIAAPMIERLGLRNMVSVNIHKSEPVWTAIEKLWEIADSKDLFMNRTASVYSYDLLLLIGQSIQLEMNSQIRKTNSQAEQNVLQKVIHIFHEQYEEPLRITYVAQMVGYTPQHVTKLFREMYGITPYKYLERIRLQEASKLIETNPALRIQDVASRVGLDVACFIRAWKKKTGTTPNRYKIDIKSGKEFEAISSKVF